MEQRINIAELLKDCPKGTKLYSPIFGDVYLDEIRPHLAIVVITDKEQGDFKEEFLYDGRYGMNGECMLFPSKENRNWNTFKVSFKEGDIIISKYNSIHILKSSDTSYIRLGYYLDTTQTRDVTPIRFASSEEKEKLFKAIKDNGYKWNAETKTLEKLIEPKFKICDRVRYKGDNTVITITGIKDTYYYMQFFNLKKNDYQTEKVSFKDQDKYELVSVVRKFVPKFKVGDKIVKKDNPTECWYVQGVNTNCNSDYFYHIVTTGKIANLHFKDQDNWELVPNKFDITTLKPFDKVLVRDTNEQKWTVDMFSFYDKTLLYPFNCIGHYINQCIPYKGNEHLLGTTNDCDEYFKTWE